jgi:hypothetical protein
MNTNATSLPELTPLLREVIQKIEALKVLEETTGTITRRARGALLRSLSDADLAVIALHLQNAGGQQ